MVAGMDVLVQIFLNVVQPNHFPSDLIVDFVSDAQHALVNERTIVATLKYELGFLVCLAIGLLYIVLMPLIGICLARQTTSRPGGWAPLYWGAYLVVMAVILVGNIYLYISNAAIKMHVDNSTTAISSTFNNLHNYTGVLLRNIEQGVNGSINLLNDKISATGQELGGQIKNTLAAELRLNEIEGHAQIMSNFNMTPELNTFNSTLTNLSSTTSNLYAVSLTLHKVLFKFQEKVTEADFGTLLRVLNTTDDNLNEIPEKINNVIDDMKLITLVTQMSNEAKEPLRSVSVTVDQTFDELKGTTAIITPTVEKVGHIIWAVGVALCCVLVLVLVRNLLGLLVGSVGVGPVFSFLLCSLLMLVVLPLFLLGGHGYTLLCKPWENGQLFRFIDTQVDLGARLGLNGSVLNLADVYKDCADERSLWDTLHLQELVDLEKMLSMPRGLNVSTFTDAFGNMNFTLKYDEEKIKNLTDLTDRVDDVMKIFINFTSTLNNVSALTITHMNLNETANQLRSQVAAFNGTVTDLLRDVDIAQGFNATDATDTMKRIVEAYFDNFANGLSARFTSQVKQVKCATVAKEIDDARSFICENMLTSLNTFWFSLGMCLIFFIPSIVLSIRLAKYYRIEEDTPSMPELTALSRREQQKSLNKKAIDQFKAMNKYSNMPYVETDYYDD